MFTVPRLSSSIKKRSMIPRTVYPGEIQQPKPQAGGQFDLPDINLGPRRTGVLARLQERGRIRKSEFSFKELQQKTNFPDLAHTEVDCMDEADLRSKFPKQGVNHKFFSSGSFRFEFWLPSDSDKVVVAQIHKNEKVRMPQDL